MKFRKTYYFFILLIPFIFSSCATLVNGKTQKIRIFCDSTVKLSRIDSVSKNITKDSQLVMLRKKKPVLLQFRLKDSSLVSYKLKSELSPAFIFGNMHLYTLPFGYIIDLCYDERFQYPPKNYFTYDTLKKKIIHSRLLPVKQNYLNFKVGVSWLNVYHNSLFYNANGSSTPFGLDLQLDYSIRPKHIISFETGLSTGLISSYPKPVYHKRRGGDDYYDSIDSITTNMSRNSWYSLSYKYSINKFCVGVGISLSPSIHNTTKYFITHQDSLFPGDSIIQKLSTLGEAQPHIIRLNKAGLIFNIDYNINRFLYTGVNWHLFITDLNKNNGIYTSHFFNFYLTCKIFRINLNKKKPYDYY